MRVFLYEASSAPLPPFAFCSPVRAPVVSLLAFLDDSSASLGLTQRLSTQVAAKYMPLRSCSTQRMSPCCTSGRFCGTLPPYLPVFPFPVDFPPPLPPPTSFPFNFAFAQGCTAGDAEETADFLLLLLALAAFAVVLGTGRDVGFTLGAGMMRRFLGSSLSLRDSLVASRLCGFIRLADADLPLKSALPGQMTRILVPRRIGLPVVFVKALTERVWMSRWCRNGIGWDGQEVRSGQTKKEKTKKTRSDGIQGNMAYD